MDAQTYDPNERRLAALYRESDRESVVQQLRPDSTGAWYLIRCQPGRDVTALNWLHRRKFGVFLAMKGLKRIAPGWLCAYVFDITEHENQILTAPGVAGILRGHDDKPLKIGDGFVLNLRMATWIGEAPKPVAAKPKKKRAKSKDRVKLKKLKRKLKGANIARSLDIRAQISALQSKMRLTEPACGRQAA